MGALDRMLEAQRAADLLQARQIEIEDDMRGLPKGSPERREFHQQLQAVTLDKKAKNREAFAARVDIMREKEREALASMGSRERISDALAAAAVRARRLEAVFNAASRYIDGDGDLAALEKAVRKARGF